MRLTIVLVCLLFIVGCNSSLKMLAPDGYIADSNNVISATGKAADTLAQQLADNIKTAQARFSDIFKRSGELFFYLILLAVAGFIFWGFTRSKLGWVIPAAALAGIGCVILMLQFGEVMYVYAKYIILLVVVIALGLITYKAVQYQRERNENKL